ADDPPPPPQATSIATARNATSVRRNVITAPPRSTQRELLAGQREGMSGLRVAAAHRSSLAATLEVAPSHHGPVLQHVVTDDGRVAGARKCCGARADEGDALSEVEVAAGRAWGRGPSALPDVAPHPGLAQRAADVLRRRQEEDVPLT